MFDMGFGVDAMVLQSDADKIKVKQYIQQAVWSGIPPKEALEYALMTVDTSWEDFLWYDKNEITNFVLEQESVYGI